MSSGKNKARTQTYNTGGLYGTASTGKNGTSYTPSAFETQLVQQTTNAIPAYLQQLVAPTYDSEIFKAQTAQRNRLANQSFENNLINPLASRGLTRGSSINQLSGQFANKLADLETDAMANEDSRIAGILNNLFNYYQVPYNMMTGLTSQTNAAYQNALQREQQSQNLWGNIAKSAAMSAGAYYGGPEGALAAGRGMDTLL